MFAHPVPARTYNDTSGTYAQREEPAPPETCGRIGEAIAATARALDVLQREISSFEDRIRPILQPLNTPPTPTGTATAKKAEPSELAAHVERGNGEIENLIAYVRSLHARVDL